MSSISSDDFFEDDGSDGEGDKGSGNTSSCPRRESRSSSHSQEDKGSASDDEQIEEKFEEQEGSDCHDEVESDKRESSDDDSEELAQLVSHSPTDHHSSPSILSKKRPTSAKNPVRVMISSSKGDPSSSLVENQIGIKGVASSKKIVLSEPGTSPLLVTKSPVHSRESPRRGWSPAPACTSTPPLTSTSRGINRVISSKEELARKDSSRPRSGGTTRQAHPAGIMHTTSHTQPRHRPLGSYTRSLNMLGVKVPAPYPHPREGRSCSSQSWEGNGRLHTQVTRRSTSLEDVTRAIPQVKTPQALHTLTVDAGQRATLSQAVYEEWYFSRCRQIRSRKARAKEEAKEKESNKEKVQQDKEMKVQAAVVDWQQKKVDHMRNTRRKMKKEVEKKDEEAKRKGDKKMKVNEVLMAWEIEKNELVAKLRDTKKKELEAKRETEKKKSLRKEESEMVFMMWKQMKMKEEREKGLRDKMEKEERKRKKEDEKLEKREIADMAFEAWKRNKNADEKIILTSHHEMEESRRHEDRSREALEAYEAWLDHVDHREPIRFYEEARASLLSQARPPWCPGGSSSSLLGC